MIAMFLTELHLNLATEREEKKLLEEQLQNLEVSSLIDLYFLG